MKTLKEQYAEIVGGYNPQYTENVSNKCVEIAENYCTTFMGWFGKKTMRELLEIFKSEQHDSSQDIKERAFNKITSTYITMLKEDTERYYHCGVSQETADAMVRSHQIELEVYHYILSLIKKDNKL